MKKFNIGFHAKVFFKGLSRVLFGALTAGTYGLSIYGFVAIPTEGGYVAVGDFVGAIATLVVALSCTYYMGCGKVVRKHKAA